MNKQILKKIVIFLGLAAVAGGLYLLDYNYPDVSLQRWFETILAFAILYGSYQLIEEFFTKSIHDAKARYSIRKVLSFVFVLVGIMIVVRIWALDPQSLLLAYGLVGAGVAVALQDVFKNLAGGVFIFLNRVYTVGDRIEVDGKFGDVMDVGLMNTTLLEIRNWVDGDQATGRLTIIPNSYSLSKAINNYTKDHNFMWDEIMIPITYDSNWPKAISIIEGIVEEVTREITEYAEKQIAHIRERYYLSKRNVEPNVFITATDNWVKFGVRFITLVRERRLTSSKIYQKIVEALEAEADIKFASATF